MIAYHGSWHLEEYLLPGDKKLSLKVPENEAHSFDIENNGIRIFKFPNGAAKTAV